VHTKLKNTNIFFTTAARKTRQRNKLHFCKFRSNSNGILHTCSCMWTSIDVWVRMRVRRDTTIKGVCVLGDHLNGMLAKRLIESKDFLKRCCAANIVFVCCLDFLLVFGSSDDSALKYAHQIYVHSHVSHRQSQQLLSRKIV
jgi:hypothetical protein